ncbi:hypothetical protein [Nocardia cyriacigeorgica]|uniref:hypothetical protein n=1 Tax=Nocardia cyriacigeorgica TaxID=135487 RepID=UPI002454C707|nr:hypothetical protein [Nocardia cyriacigeorgica]
MRPRGFTDELRAVLRVDGQPWGRLSLFRERGRASFDGGDIAFLHSLSTPMARRLRGCAQPVELPGTDLADSPGMLIFDADGALLSINDETRYLLAEMPPGPVMTTSGIDLPLPTHRPRYRARSGPGRELTTPSAQIPVIQMASAAGVPRSTG